jgi:AraC family transcriptional regulator, transcriptional activator of pobA
MDEIKRYDSMRAFVNGAIGASIEADVDVSVNRLEVLHAHAPYVSPQFRANYYSVVLIRAGAGSFILDGNRHVTRAGTIYFTNPGHVKGFEIDVVSHGYILTFSEGFLRAAIRNDALDDFPFLIAEAAPPFYTDEAGFAPFERLGAQLLDEFGRASTYRNQLIGALLWMLLFRFKEAFWDRYDPRVEGDAGSPIVTAFRRNIDVSVRALREGASVEQPSLTALAAAQHLHPNYLSTVIKAKTGRTVTAWIAERLAAEASALLGAPGASVKDVCYRLGFSDPAHFSRFFKAHVGLAPSVFQKRAQL